MKNLRIKVTESCYGDFWMPHLYLGKKVIFLATKGYERKGNAIRVAKRLSEQTGIKYDSSKIIKQHGC